MRQSPSTSTNGFATSLRRLDQILQAEFQRMASKGLLEEHPARGLFLDPAYVRTLLDISGSAPAARSNTGEAWPAMTTLQATFALGQAECDIILLAIAPEIDVRYESIYAYLHNDVTRKKPSIELAARLFLNGNAAGKDAWRYFHFSSALVKERLISVSSGTFASRVITADAGLAAFLAGNHCEDLGLLDDRLAALATWLPYEKPAPLPFEMNVVEGWRAAAKHLSDSGGLLLLRGRPGSGKQMIATTLSRLQKRPVIASRVPVSQPRDANEISDGEAHSFKSGQPPSDVTQTLGLLRRESRLRRATVYLSLPAETPLSTVRAAFDGSGVVVICGRRGRHDDDKLADFSFDVPTLPAEAQCALWRQELKAEPVASKDLKEVASKFSLTLGQISAAAQEAMRYAKLRGVSLPADEDLHRAARNQAGSGLMRLASRVELCYSWEDLVLPPHILHQLSDIRAQVRHREKVYREWGFAARIGPARGIAVLFAGPSGTGKTMSASVLARELGLELYRIDLATIVSKYIGETEKNLSRIFEEAEDSNAILLFDEADALFGKRSEVKDAHDRYANLEVAYLLQRMETYSGIAILATNLAANLDEAFARRMAHLVEFVSPDATLRERLWRRSLPALAPVENSVNFAALAHQFQVSGGNIRNIALSAAFLASEQNTPIAMAHLIRATARELEKIGRQPSRAEFSEFYPLVEQRQ